VPRDAVPLLSRPSRPQLQGKICPCKETSPLQPWGWSPTGAEGDGAHTTDGISIALTSSGHALLDEQRGFGFLLPGPLVPIGQPKGKSSGQRLSSPHSIYVLNLGGQT